MATKTTANKTHLTNGCSKSSRTGAVLSDDRAAINCVKCVAIIAAQAWSAETEADKQARKDRVEDAACTLQANAVDTAKDLNPRWREMSETDWMNAVYEQKTSQLSIIADQYRVEPDELRDAMGLL